MREWKEIQKVLRGVNKGARGQGLGASFLLVAGLAQGIVFPEQVGEYRKASTSPAAIADRELYSEFGLQESERAEFLAGAQRFAATGWRMLDPTGALALFESLRPANAPQAPLAALSARTADGVIVVYGNYVLQFAGVVPDKRQLDEIYNQLPQLGHSPLPALVGFLPQENLIANSERYVLGPVSLERFEPRISPSVAAFHLSSEAQLGRYRTPKGVLTLAIFNYPTPGLAKERYEEFLRVPGSLAKRTGPLVAVIIGPPDADEAERVLARVRYEANLSWNETVKVDETKGFANLFLGIFTLAGVLIALCVLVGIGVGGFRILLRRMGVRVDPAEMTVLRIRDE
jgi:hypothetical protein